MNKNIPFKNKILLAPMEEINDIAFRLLCKKAGAGITYTGLTHPLTPQKIYLDDKPILQIFQTSTKGIKSFIKKYDKYVSGWDFNLGCPATSARKHGFGSFLKNIKTIEEILKTIQKSTKKPLSIKFRKSSYASKLVKLANKYCDYLCIHPRKREQGYSGKPDINFAKEIKSKSKIPVIYSGNVNLKNYKNLLKNFDYIMIGREAIGRPGIFSKMKNEKFKFFKTLLLQRKITFKNYLKLAKKYKLQFRQIKFQAMNFTKSKSKAKKTRLQIYNCKTLNELKKIKIN